MSKKAKVTLVIVALMLLFVTAVLGGYWYWLGENRAGLQQKQAEGLAFGKQTDDQGCWREGIQRQRQAQNFTASVQNNSFLLACLAAAANPPGFCAGVPLPGEVLDTAGWTWERCARTEMQQLSKSDCQSVLRTLQTYCSEYYKR